MEDEILYGFDYFHTIHRRVCEGWKYFGVMYKILDRFSEILLRLEPLVKVSGGMPLNNFLRILRSEPFFSQDLLTIIMTHEVFMIFLNGNIDSRIL